MPNLKSKLLILNKTKNGRQKIQIRKCFNWRKRNTKNKKWFAVDGSVRWHWFQSCLLPSSVEWTQSQSCSSKIRSIWHESTESTKVLMRTDNPTATAGGQNLGNRAAREEDFQWSENCLCAACWSRFLNASAWKSKWAEKQGRTGMG